VHDPTAVYLSYSNETHHRMSGLESSSKIKSSPFMLHVLEIGPDLPQLVRNRNGVRTLVS